jgi:hypothetical protein
LIGLRKFQFKFNILLNWQNFYENKISLLFNKMQIKPVNALAAIPDPRRAQGKRYDLPHLLLFSLLAVASGATSYRRVHQFIATHWQRLNQAFGGRWQRAPAYPSIRYALQGLEATAVERACRTHATTLAGEPKAARPAIAIDGKTRRGSLDRFEDRKAAQVLNALAGDSQLVLGHVLIEDADKDHEIQAAHRLLQDLDLSGRLSTLDALHLQKTR